MLENVIENWTSRLDYIRASSGSPMPEIIFKIQSGKKKLCLQEALDLIQNLRSENTGALIDDSSDEEVPANNLLEFFR
ncbi:hypothetical protein TNCV_4518471 [Trichonephila clavipes]|nr:hypothetical protein TNCV_4518471 [Trichonephila clavipes]